MVGFGLFNFGSQTAQIQQNEQAEPLEEDQVQDQDNLDIQARQEVIEEYIASTVREMIQDRDFNNLALSTLFTSDISNSGSFQFNNGSLGTRPDFPGFNNGTHGTRPDFPGFNNGSLGTRPDFPEFNSGSLGAKSPLDLLIASLVDDNGSSDDDPPIDHNKFNLDYVGGLDEAVCFLRRNVVLPWAAEAKNYGKALGDILEPAKGIIFYGPPGTGKTLMAKCLAGELQKLMGRKISFIMKRGTDTFSKYVGESEANLRKVFLKAEKMKPSVIFFDEIDALIPERKKESHEHTTSMVTTFLGMVDKMKRGEVFIIGATNRLDSLDPASLRPGRFDKHIRFTPPNEAGRIHILNINLNKWNQKKPTSQEIAQIASHTVGYTGADLEQLIRNATNCAIERDLPKLGSNLQNIPQILESLKSVKVTMADWTKALEGMKSTNTNVFGSTIYCGVALNKVMCPLVGGIVQTLKIKIERFLDLCTSNNSSTGIKSFLCYGESESEIKTIDTLLLPAVIGSFDSMKVKGFISSESGEDVFKALDKATTGALEKPSILFIPRIDKVWVKLTKEGTQNIFLNKVEETRKSNLVILASAICNLDVFPLALQNMFQGADRSIQPRKPTQDEIREFLAPIFAMNSIIHKNFAETTKNQLCCGEAQLEEILNNAVAAANGEEIQTILTFHQELVLVLSGFYNETEHQHSDICKALNDTISTFIRTKLLP